MVASSRRVGKLIRRPPITITPRDTLLDVVDKLVENNVGALVVVEPTNPKKAIAVISERDVVRALNMRVALSTPVEVFMSTSLISIKEDEDVARALDLMLIYNIRHIVVTNREGELVGVISIRDVARALRESC